MTLNMSKYCDPISLNENTVALSRLLLLRSKVINNRVCFLPDDQFHFAIELNNTTHALEDNINLSDFSVNSTSEESCEEIEDTGSDDSDVVIVEIRKKKVAKNRTRKEVAQKHRCICDSHSVISSRSCSGSNSNGSDRNPRSSSSLRNAGKKRKSWETEEPNEICDSYYCSVCNIKMSSEIVYTSHMNGQKHQKILRARNPLLAMSKTVRVAEVDNKYPQPPSGVYRKKKKSIAKIQDYLEKNLKRPCPGLDQVTEIQGLSQLYYYCKMCDLSCSVNCILSHLRGFPHQINCLRYFNPNLYEKFCNLPKGEIQGRLLDILRDIERRNGLRNVTVEKEVLSNSYCSWQETKEDHNQPSTSSDHYLNFEDDSRENYDLPDRKKPGFYCKLCEAPMSSLAIFQSHIIGKRHLANLKKIPGAVPSKAKNVKVSVRAKLIDKLKYRKGPIVGLNQIQEIQNIETKTEQYQCFLCGGCYTTEDIIEHLISEKHKMKYLSYIQHPDLELLEHLNSKRARHCIERICDEVERERGRGVPYVVMPKSTLRS